ncbi:MAG TPA: heme ABC transporter ATP-binding protein [Pseudogracilibacillus sp.]|nr:heme ABC transporter ATP-binding protein [Pseudogracilibacillus sp.]
MHIGVENVAFSIQGKQIISDIDLETQSGEFVGIVGPNGSGKSTLLKNIYRVHQPDCGKITMNHDEIFKLSMKETAKNMAVVSQESSSLFDFSVREIVLMGRAPHKKLLETDNAEDGAIAEEALEKVGMTAYQNRSIATLSGGEKQRVMVARALAQQAKVLVLDEPTNHLDVHHQLQLMDLIKTLGITTVTVLHDLNIAARYCDRIYMMNHGRIAASGTPEEVFTEEMLQDVFRVHTSIITHPKTGKTHITFLSSITSASEEKLALHQ